MAAVCSARSRRRSISDIVRPEPPQAGAEKETLTGFLDWQRLTVLVKIDGVSDADLRRPMVPSGTSMLGMVKHLAYVERWWFQKVFMDQDVSFPWSEDDWNADFRIEADETTQDIVDLYKRESDVSRAIIAAASLDDLSRYVKTEGHKGLGTTSLRWILLHMLEEVARHNGHADILREMIDGTTGE